MEFGHFEFSQNGATFAASGPQYQMPGSFSMESSPNFHPVDGGVYVSGFELYDEAHLHQGMGLGCMEENDVASRSRLSQEQLARLQREFDQRNKPNTDYKKHLAEVMGVDYQRINNWFQNRRAKKKQEQPQEAKIDLSTDEETQDYSLSSVPALNHETEMKSRPSSHFSSPVQASFTSGDYVASLEHQALHNSNLNNQNSSSISQPKFDTTFNPQQLLQTDYLNAFGAETIWSIPDMYDISAQKALEPTVVERDPLEWSPATEPGGQFNGPGVTQTKIGTNSQQLYVNTLNGNTICEPLSQAFTTASGAEHQELITPPQEISPMPGLTEGIFNRRDSNSSELAEDFDTIHLQQPNTGLGLHQNSSTTSTSASEHNFAPITGLVTPSVSPDTVAAKPPFTMGRDLASRRKRPRPAALQPESARSVSFAGPSTASPHLRVSSPGTGRISPVRRIKSTGNNLSVSSGRVTKSGSLPAQKSPRNFESCFQLEKISQPNPNDSLPAHAPHATIDLHNIMTTTSGPVANLPSSSWVDFPSQHGAAGFAWDQSGNGSAVANFAAGLSLPPSPPNRVAPSLPFSQHPQVPQNPYHCPPQSAPPHLTSFFNGSPPLPSNSFSHGGWPTPSITPPDPYPQDQSTRPSHLLHHSQSQPYNLLPDPIQDFQGYQSDIGSFYPYQAAFGNLPTSIRKELDIKIEKGPPPPKELLQTSQENKVYSFNNSTPEDFAADTSGRK